ncbi:serine/arginine repetitive matrix protein 2-like isoform X2 [Trichogramma pretiosum]|uniref:serine/arginine repetitive matrix protein 2-like isoform X2 n=1 Tax=Trichogramma pretiosum TaxID=7493 RepID=UPI0006C9E351|nr:serine/arginine repetitive matrix protein 2-like isoform X2 [Trichogramma pretiosum]
MTKMPSVADAMDSRHDGYAMVKNRVSSSTKTSFAEIERVARFQQKQLQEKEHKLLQLYDQQQQRAHQVAQRGSAGSNGSSNGTSATNSLNKQRMFEDNNRRQANAKGIDKSYPLEPLSNGSKKQMTNGKSGSSKIASSSSNGTSSCRRGTLNGTSTVNNKRTTTTKTTGSTNGRSSVTVQQQRETTSYSTSRAIYRESVSQGEKKQNGTDEEQSSCNRRQSNGHNHYEINIDDVIDNEAMQRNRMLAKFNQSDIEKRRRRYSEEPNLLVEVRDGDAKSNGSNGDVATPTAPSKANGRRKIPRQSSLMKTTKSSALKMKKPLRTRSVAAADSPHDCHRRHRRRRADDSIGNVAETTRNHSCCEEKIRCSLDGDWCELKSTSLIHDILRRQSCKSAADEAEGKVRTIVGKIEYERSRSVSPIPPDPVASGSGANKSASASAIPRPVVAGRRTSFEMKRLMFEQIQAEISRRDSLEAAAVRLLDQTLSSSPVAVQEARPIQPEDRSTARICANDERENVRGFEKYTSAWLFKSRRDEAGGPAAVVHHRAPSKSPPPPAPRKTGCNGGSSARRSLSCSKIFEPRDSIELTRGRSPPTACARLRHRHRRSPSPSPPNHCHCDPPKEDPTVPKQQQQQKQQPQSQSSPSVKSRVAELKVLFSGEGVPKLSNLPTISVSTPTTATTKNDESPSWRSKTRSTTSPAKSVDAADEGRLLSPTAASASRSSLDSATDETTDEQSPSVQPAPRTSSLSSNSSIATNKSHGSAASAKAAAAAAASTASSRSTPTPAARTSPGGVKTSAQSEGSLNTCKICKRRFASDRIGLHEKICSKSATKKRKTFDTQTQRIKGTELEDYAPKLTTQSSNNSKKLQSKSQPQAPPKVESQKSNWRRKHEDFINAIRSAKQMQAHLAAGGKLSDLPPPPASDTSDYKQCPHCSRRFSPGAAERHIPKCETMQHNKPKVQPRTRSKII